MKSEFLREHLGFLAQQKAFINPLHPLSDQDISRKRDLWIEAIYQAFSEIMILNEFISVANELGFPVSHMPKWIAPRFSVEEYIERVYPPQINVSSFFSGDDDRTGRERTKGTQIELWANPTVALAQHHGIPTRLLDWTRNPLVAAFFAANAVRDSTADDMIVIFAFHSQSASSNIRIVEVPFSDNEFLRAQSGVFTLDLLGEELLLRNGHYPTIEESLDNSHYTLIADALRPRKYKLPVSQAPELLRLLWLERTTQAHLMPTLDNVVHAVLTKIRLLGTTSSVDLLNETE